MELSYLYFRDKKINIYLFWRDNITAGRRRAPRRTPHDSEKISEETHGKYGRDQEKELRMDPELGQ
jgi:hypothetical protein